jgi:hypothetical protein
MSIWVCEVYRTCAWILTAVRQWISISRTVCGLNTQTFGSIGKSPICASELIIRAESRGVIGPKAGITDLRAYSIGRRIGPKPQIGALLHTQARRWIPEVPGRTRILTQVVGGIAEVADRTVRIADPLPRHRVGIAVVPLRTGGNAQPRNGLGEVRSRTGRLAFPTVERVAKGTARAELSAFVGGGVAPRRNRSGRADRDAAAVGLCVAEGVG